MWLPAIFDTLDYVAAPAADEFCIVADEHHRSITDREHFGARSHGAVDAEVQEIAGLLEIRIGPDDTAVLHPAAVVPIDTEESLKLLLPAQLIFRTHMRVF